MAVSIFIPDSNARGFPLLHTISSTCCLWIFGWWPWGEVISHCSFDFLAIISERCLRHLLVLKYYVSKDHFLSRSYFLQHLISRSPKMKGFQAKYTVCISPVLSSTPARSPLVGPYHAVNDTEKLNSVDAGTTGRWVPCYDVFHLLVWVSTSGMWSQTGDVAEHFPSASLCHFGFLLCSLSESWPLCAGQPDSAWVVKLYLNSARVPEQVMCWDTIQNASHSKSNCKRSVAVIPGFIWAILFVGMRVLDWGLSRWQLVVKKLPANVGNTQRFDPWIRKIPWRRKWQPTPVLYPGESHGQRNLADHRPWGCKESKTTEHADIHEPFFRSGGLRRLSCILTHCFCGEPRASHCSGFSCCGA